MLLAVMVMFCLWGNAQKPILKPLAIGDNVSDLIFSNLINYHKQTAVLSDFKGKLVVLDFWATWCTNCLKVFPKLQKIQAELSGNVQVILINGQINDRGKVGELFFNSWIERNCQTFSIPSVMNDTMLRKIFPHKYLPYSVVIDTSGRIAAFISPDILSTPLLKEILNQTNQL